MFNFPRSPEILFLMQMDNRPLLNLITNGIADWGKEGRTRFQSAMDNAKTSFVKLLDEYTKSNKEKMEGVYKDYINILQEVRRDISSIYDDDTRFNSIKDAYVSAISTQIDEAVDLADRSLNNQVWDRLVVGFFGETNAGKSTIVETFRILFDKNRKSNNDGLIVGDGRHDFTRDYSEYDLTINGIDFTLIDVPGIEGNENEVKDNILKGLSKAHIIFYVQGENQKPNSATAEKIKRYLSDGAKVYSIYNIKGGVGNYDEESERETLLTDSVIKTNSLIYDTFEAFLGKDTYQGSIALQAYLAMCANATFSSERQDLIKNQKKLLKYFGSSSEVLQFSQFQVLVDLVFKKSKNAQEEIVESNKNKLVSLIKRAYKSFSATTTEQSEIISRKLQEHNNFKNAIAEIFDDAKIHLRKQCDLEINGAFNQFKDEVERSIVQEIQNFDGAESILKYNIENGIKHAINSAVASIKNDVKKKQAYFNVSFTPFSVQGIQAGQITENMDYNWGDFGSDVLSVLGYAGTGAGLGSVIPVLGTAIGAVVGAVFGILVSIFKDRSEKIREAQNKARVEIEKARKTTIDNFHSKSLPFINEEFENKEDNVVRSVDESISKLNTIDSSIKSTQLRIREYAENLRSKKYGSL